MISHPGEETLLWLTSGGGQRSAMPAMNGILAFCLFFSFAYAQEGNITATFNMSDVQGVVMFTPGSRTGTTMMQLNLKISKSYRMEIREFPVLFSQAKPCDDINIGQSVASFPAITITTANAQSSMEQNISLYDAPDSVVGRSVLLTSGDARSCATILKQQTPMAKAVLMGSTSGTVEIRELKAGYYSVLSDLFSTNDKPDARNITLTIFEGWVNADLPSSIDPPDLLLRCSNVTSSASITSISNVPVAGDGSRSKSLQFITSNSSLFGASKGARVQINDPSGDVCANINVINRKSVQAYFNAKGVTGYMNFTQFTPYDPTVVEVNLQNLAKRAQFYHVHMWPMPYRYMADSDVCSGQAVGGHHAPLGAGTGPTQDKYEIGDLSGKYGNISGLNDLLQSYVDWNLPLFGQNSIIGRSVVIHSAPNGERWICANLNYPSEMVFGVAEFNDNAYATIYFAQQKDEPQGDTFVHLVLSNSAFDSITTDNHHYHVHKTIVGDDTQLEETKRCLSTGGHYNPFAVSIKSGYAAACGNNSLRCEVGDLSGKFGTVSLKGLSQGAAKYAFTDISLPLSSAYSILNKSVVIHNGDNRLSCATIQSKVPVIARTESNWKGVDSAPLSGGLTFTDNRINGLTRVEVALDHLNSNAGGYHVHELPLNRDNPGSNICSTAAGHYNPLGAVVPAVVGDTYDNIEIGDLSTKYGNLSALDKFSITKYDTNLPLRDMHAVVGRSVVIHAANGTRWKCADVVFDAEAMRGKLIQAQATFDGDIQGNVTFSQVVWKNGYSGVTVMIQLRYKNASATTENHNWHVHINQTEGGCTGVGGHYNPFNKAFGKEEYKSYCKPNQTRHCEVGDLSGKFAPVNISIGSQKVYNDETLSLIGVNSVMGRSIVVHEKNGAASLIACADILPLGSVPTRAFSIPKQDGNFKNALASAIAIQLSTSKQNIAIVVDGQTEKCTQVTVYFSGLEADALKQRFDSSKLGSYSSSSVCQDSSSAHLNFISVILILGGAFIYVL